MSNTLQIISIQHELAMATGVELRLDPMLQQFTIVCLRRLGLVGMHFFLLQDESGNAMLPSNESHAGIRHYLSLPGDTGIEGDTTRFFEPASGASGFACEHEDEQFIYCFRLGELGFVFFRRLAEPIDQAILLSLRPIISRLATSSHAALEHEQLLQAIDARKQAEEAVVFQLYHDDLTRLPNRRHFMERLEQDISRCRRHKQYGAVLFADLDRFKAINDTFGHSVGDKLLKTVASLLTGSVRREDTVARLSGDEFVVLLNGLGDEHGAAAIKATAVARKILELFAKPLLAGEHRLQVTPSLGIEVYPSDGTSAEDILRHADTAMYEAKSSGRNAAVFYDRQMSEELEERLAIEKDLHAAVKHFRDFQLYYQPQFHHSGELIGAEALLRWHNNQRGPVSPALFIPVAEETGLIIDLGDWVMRTACEHLRALEIDGLPPSFERLSLNVSTKQLCHRQFLEKTQAIIRNSAIEPANLGIELTEGTLIENTNATVEKMNRLWQLGVHFSIDDFGTGYSSLSYLTRFPLGTLKIDQAFVRDIHASACNQAIVETIMALGNSLGLSIIAEGVETAEELECLLEFGCEQYQGYYFSRPIPFVDLRALVQEQRLAVTHEKIGSNSNS